MNAKKRTRAEITADRSVFSHMFFEENRDIDEIVEWVEQNRRYTLARSTVHYDIDAVRKSFAASTHIPLEQAKGRELQLIAKVIKEAEEAWQKSKKPTRIEKRSVHGFEESSTQSQSVEEKDDGPDPAFLRVMLQCSRQRADLLQLDSDPGTDTNVNDIIAALTGENSGEKFMQAALEEYTKLADSKAIETSYEVIEEG